MTERYEVRKYLTQWDYKVVKATVIETENYLNELGQDGWQLVSIYEGMMYFRRPNLWQIKSREREQYKANRKK